MIRQNGSAAQLACAGVDICGRFSVSEQGLSLRAMQAAYSLKRPSKLGFCADVLGNTPQPESTNS